MLQSCHKIVPNYVRPKAMTRGSQLNLGLCHVISCNKRDSIRSRTLSRGLMQQESWRVKDSTHLKTPLDACFLD